MIIYHAFVVVLATIMLTILKSPVVIGEMLENELVDILRMLSGVFRLLNLIFYGAALWVQHQWRYGMNESLPNIAYRKQTGVVQQRNQCVEKNY